MSKKCASYRFYYVCSLEKSIFSAIPECQVAPAMSYQKIVVQRMECSSRQIFLKGLFNNEFLDYWFLHNYEIYSIAT